MKQKYYFAPKNKGGFTLAETLIALTVLGIVAAITIPGLINKQQEAANRTKVKKAMTMYEKALNNMIIENDLKTNQAIIDFGAEGGACANTTAYFKKVEGDGCRFKTADRIWWDITEIENPLIILNDKKKEETVANLQTLAKDTDDITTYGFVGKLDDTKGIVRINDTSYKPGTNDEGYLTKLYGFIGKKKNDEVDPTDYATPCPTLDISCYGKRILSYPQCENPNCGYSHSCTNCIGYVGQTVGNDGKWNGQLYNNNLTVRMYNSNNEEVWYRCSEKDEKGEYKISKDDCSIIRLDVWSDNQGRHAIYRNCTGPDSASCDLLGYY